MHVIKVTTVHTFGEGKESFPSVETSQLNISVSALVLNVHSLDKIEDYSLVGVVASVGTVSVVVGNYSKEGEKTSTVSEAVVQGTPC